MDSEYNPYDPERVGYTSLGEHCDKEPIRVSEGIKTEEPKTESSSASSGWYPGIVG